MRLDQQSEPIHYNDHAAGRIWTLAGLSKAELNNQLLSPLSDSALKKITKADLLAMVEAEAAQEKQATKKQRAPHGLDDRVIDAPTTNPEAVKAVVEGSKRVMLLTCSHGRVAAPSTSCRAP